MKNCKLELGDLIRSITKNLDDYDENSKLIQMMNYLSTKLL